MKTKKELKCYDKIVDDIYWFFGYIDGIILGCLFEGFYASNGNKQHIDTLVFAFESGVEEGEYIYDHATI